jgi:hypothetical protein
MKDDFKEFISKKNIGLQKLPPLLEINFPVNYDVHQRRDTSITLPQIVQIINREMA